MTEERSSSEWSDVRQPSRARTAIERDIEIIEGWLPPPSSDVESMAVNWNLALEKYETGQLLVWDDGLHNPVAYFWGTLTSTSSVLEVRPDKRNKGVGRAFITHLIELARANGEVLLTVECAPHSSAPFWSALGFAISVEGGRRLIGRRILEYPQTLPAGPVFPVTITFIRLTFGKVDVMPVAQHYLSGVFDDAGVLRLNKKVGCFNLSGLDDLALQIDVDGKMLFRDDVRMAETQKIGLTRCANGYTLGAIAMESIVTTGLDWHR